MTNNTPEETGDITRPDLYTLDVDELQAAARALTKLNDLYSDNIYLELSEKVLIRSLDDWMPIGYAVFEGEGWYFESITNDERETIGKD